MASSWLLAWASQKLWHGGRLQDVGPELSSAPHGGDRHSRLKDARG